MGMIRDLFSSLDCGQLGSLSFLTWLTPILVASIFLSSSSWKRQPSGILILLLATNRETRAKGLLPLPLFLFGLILFLVIMNLIGLIPFLVLVETVRIIIRPLTLTVRLIANIRAGHIVMSLIANCLVRASISALIPVFLINVGYTLFEVFVCFIQAYIFTLLVKLYAEEHP